jgi:hypothetical protein
MTASQEASQNLTRKIDKLFYFLNSVYQRASLNFATLSVLGSMITSKNWLLFLTSSISYTDFPYSMLRVTDWISVEPPYSNKLSATRADVDTPTINNTYNSFI